MGPFFVNSFPKLKSLHFNKLLMGFDNLKLKKSYINLYFINILFVTAKSNINSFFVSIIKYIQQKGENMKTLPNSVKSKVGDHSRGWPEGSLFDSYYTKV